MAKKKKKQPMEEIDDVPNGKVDDEGDEILDLYNERDNLDDDLEYNLDEVEDEMLADETEDEEFGPEIDEVEKLMRKVKCDPCPGSSSKKKCKVRDDFGCPPNKAKK
jgi:hypothetical protein